MERCYEKKDGCSKGLLGLEVSSAGQGDGKKLVSIQLPLPMAEVLAELPDVVERITQSIGIELALCVLNAEVEALAGPANAQLGELRRAYRWGREPGYVVYGGKKVRIERPRVRREGQGEIPLRSYSALHSNGKMQRAVANQVFLGVSTRNYARAVEDCLEGYGIERSSVSRHFVMASAQKVRELCERRLEDLKLVAVLVDGVEFAGTTVVVALAVAQDGRKHILGFWQGATENATVGTALLEDLVSRGLDPSRQYLFVIDGSKALHKALHQVFGSDLLVQRCQVHKKRNVLDHLPEAYHPALRMRLNTAYGMNDCAEALKAIRATVDWLREYSEGAARSLEEGLEETLTVHRLGLPDALRRSLSSTNIIESCFSMVRARTARVKRWRDDQMIKRWAGTMLLQAEKRFRKVRGYRFMPMLVNALQTKGALASKKKAG